MTCLLISVKFYIFWLSLEECYQIKSELQKTEFRCIQFFYDFDDMEPLKLKNTPQDDRVRPKEMPDFMRLLQNIYVPYIETILQFDEIANQIIRKLIEISRPAWKK
ncbi:hypothetical protein RF11_10592 [Thelohanellus kitauei]|uniref:Uncharacterized protein n=1 Tax=Thelohanellus kitauei TaxID=669202 RepID=A0A0C2N4B0_THEKT|nr:hypothetical protein RF11_10592 [Thelohanellus kitauei]